MGLTQFFMSPKSDQKRAKCPIFCWYGTFSIFHYRNYQKNHVLFCTLSTQLHIHHCSKHSLSKTRFLLQKLCFSLSTLKNILFLCIVSTSSTTFQNASKATSSVCTYDSKRYDCKNTFVLLSQVPPCQKTCNFKLQSTSCILLAFVYENAAWK